MRIWAAVSGHGYGHFVQAAVLLNQVHAQRPELVVHVAGNMPPALARDWLRTPFTLGPPHGDVYLVQQGPLKADLKATRQVLRQLHANWEMEAEGCRQALQAWRPDLLLADVPYLPVAAAAACGVPAVVACSFSWDRVLSDCLSLADAEVRGWWQRARDSYGCAAAAIGLTPWAFDDDLCPIVYRTEPIAEPVPRRPEALRERLGVDATRPIVLVTMGGVGARDLPLEAMRAETRIVWLVPGPADLAPNVRALGTLGALPFAQIVASADAIVGKLGYNTAVQAAICGTPLLYVRRPRFPDEIDLAVWLHQHHKAREISVEAFASGRSWYDDLQALWSLPPHTEPPPNGLEAAAALLLQYLPHQGTQA